MKNTAKQFLSKYWFYILLVGASLTPLGTLIYMPKPTWIPTDYVIAISGILYFVLLTVTFLIEREKIYKKIERLEIVRR